MNKILAGLSLFSAMTLSSVAHAELQDLSQWTSAGSVSKSSNSASLVASGANTAFAGGTTGSLLYTTMNLDAGTTVSFDWLFKANDYIPFNDFASFKIDGETFKLSDVATVGNYGSSGWNTFSYTLNKATFGTLAFIVSNYGDQVLNSNLNVSNLNIAAVPEPETYALMMTGLLGLLYSRKKKAQQ